MKNQKTIVLIAFALLLGQELLAQKSKVRQGDKHYNALAYAEAIEDYSAAIEMGATKDQIATQLANSYFEVRDFDNAVTWFEEAVKTDESPENFLRYSESLRSTGKYAEAKQAADRYLATNTGDRRAQKIALTGAAKSDLMASADRYTLTHLAINTDKSDFGTSWYGDQVVFASSRAQGVATKRFYRWNNEPFLDLYTASVESDGILTGANSFSSEVNSKLHEGPCTFSTEQDKVYFSRNNYYKGKKGKDKKDIVRLKIYSAQKGESDWINVTPFAFNSDDYSVSHPTLTKDNKTMYFASDMPGGFGGVDIWKTSWDGTGWSTPTNLGPVVNTEGDEMFPFVHQDGAIYFSSTGHTGLGGLDVLMTSPIGSSFEEPQNMGYPINTTADDFAFILHADGTQGFVSSNREGGSGDDDIYGFTMKPEDKLLVSGCVIDAVATSSLEKARVRLVNSSGEVIEQIETPADGRFNFCLPKGECNLTIQIDNGEGWSEYRSQNTPCDQTNGTIDLGDVPLEKMAWAARGNVRNKTNNAPVGGFSVTLTDKSTGEKFTKTTTDDGGVLYALRENTDYEIRFEKEGYFTKSGSFTTQGMEPGTLDINKYVDLSFEPLVIGKGIKIENIYYDYNKSHIRPDAAVELDKIVALLTDNPTLVVEMGSHTDARGSNSYNQSLSQRRAKAAVEYLISKGVREDHLSYKGYGESVVLNKCADGVTCSDEEHEANRRTEFKVLGIIKE